MSKVQQWTEHFAYVYLHEDYCLKIADEGGHIRMDLINDEGYQEDGFGAWHKNDLHPDYSADVDFSVCDTRYVVKFIFPNIVSVYHRTYDNKFELVKYVYIPQDE